MNKKKYKLILICNEIFDFLSHRDKEYKKISIKTKRISKELFRPDKSTTVKWATGIGKFTIYYG